MHQLGELDRLILDGAFTELEESRERIKQLEQLCRDMYADNFEHDAFTERMDELGLLEGSEL